jgi:hypothetical protein
LATARDLINGSLRLLGVVASGESATASEHVDALSALNALLESWAHENLLIPEDTRESFDLTGGKATYSMGNGADFDTSRPTKILSARVYDPSTNALTPVEILNTEEWDAQQIKNLSGSLVLKLYPEYTYPHVQLSVWPIPDSTKSLEITSLKQITQITSVNSGIALQPGYWRALRYNLAIELAPEFGKSVSPEIAQVAEESKANLKSANRRDIYMTCDGAALMNKKRSYNILADD